MPISLLPRFSIGFRHRFKPNRGEVLVYARPLPSRRDLPRTGAAARHNHDTFALRRIDEDPRLDLIKGFAVTELPALIVSRDGKIRVRLEQPRSCVEIQTLLATWLHTRSNEARTKEEKLLRAEQELKARR